MAKHHPIRARSPEADRAHLEEIRQIRFGRTAAERRAARPPVETLGRPAVRLLCYHGRNAVPVAKIYVKGERQTLVIDDERRDLWSFSSAAARCRQCSAAGRGSWQMRPQDLRERRRRYPSEVAIDVALVSDRVCVLCRAHLDTNGRGHDPACLREKFPLAP